ncbi:hypothetical protein OEZ85_009599 [Tetradesmus obliquus]|uniref:Uncharacterized protein n=1 Tax=Tetradesmus obliquus TaxID=3088 RepID=A0ABY8UDE5_TETOB|nr:hypothetical protein OEZ85_009599 [Tetradesmus obliquus]
MGQAASAGRSYKAAEAAGKAAAAAVTQDLGAVAADAQRAAQHAQRKVLTLEEEEQHEARDESLGSMLDKLGGAIHGTSLNIMPTERLAQATPSSAGRLPPHALQELLQLQSQAAGGPIDASHIINKYKADPQLVQAVLSVVCLPEVVEAQGSAGIEAFAEHPVWFGRRR